MCLLWGSSRVRCPVDQLQHCWRRESADPRARNTSAPVCIRQYYLNSFSSRLDPSSSPLLVSCSHGNPVPGPQCLLVWSQVPKCEVPTHDHSRYRTQRPPACTYSVPRTTLGFLLTSFSSLSLFGLPPQNAQPLVSSARLCSSSPILQ
jgi:hypothetical protein